VSAWRTSQMMEYVFHGIDSDFVKKFRMSTTAFNDLVKLIESERIPDEHGRALIGVPGCVPKKTSQLIPTRFKVGACVYLLALGPEIPVVADVCCLKDSTVRRWVHHFCRSVFRIVKPIYMPAEPPSSEQLAAVRSEFAARRGIPNVAMACDGTHVPFSTHDSDYRNYKGWYSTLMLAFVNSYHLFIDADVGFAGRSGDNTILKYSWLMHQLETNREAWLGKDGVVLGDGGASDGDGVFMNPYRTPSSPEDSWFNFCHSSTRFVVEETFGRWKNRFRFLLRVHDMQHELHTKLVYASTILYNYCTIKKDDALGFDVGSADEWNSFFEKYKRHACPSCARYNKGHCVHAGRHRATALHDMPSGKPSEQRNEIRDRLWQRLCCEGVLVHAGEEGHAEATGVDAVQEMQRRARAGY